MLFNLICMRLTYARHTIVRTSGATPACIRERFLCLKTGREKKDWYIGDNPFFKFYVVFSKSPSRMARSSSPDGSHECSQ